MSKKLQIVGLFVALALLSLAWSPSRATASDPHATFQSANMFVFGDPSRTPLPGAATLIRTRDGITFRVYTSGLKAEDLEPEPRAYTVWIVLFGKPQNCANGPGACMGADLGNPAVRGSVVYGAGAIVGADGVANFQGSLAEGPPPQGILVNVPAGTVNGLKDSMKTEVHLVVRPHGEIEAGRAVEQLTTFEAGCGDPCNEVQAVVFDAVK